MNLQVINRELSVGNIEIAGVASSSLVLVGDADIIQLASAFDTPPESLIIGPFVPLTPKG
ncbi:MULTISPECIES: spore gernimation protein GerPD [Rossellomorea]|jgi:spore germination protein PD|uniref:Spore gernimation protein GerPD n=2 Tax=Bacillaceae TaxID=186817 RepID=A0A5D4UVZ8_9BACI|nr:MULTISPECIES: spore gernimation protein GerPD [Rossellomorea]NMH69510.1 spore gernimation protein GerPD [Bacillus sp. RO3]WJV29236.1 spore gernimation protein GerPD [Rossellomorea sp. AcN35-11]MCA1062001.1 spore gernimation protein GerPD [Rossellomorea aquimaris]MDT9023542.1 spore gernimation protein GerPD [Rossellomorea sp. YC4-1]TYS80170.1 spore gernimation protein GerPD [Rossellomorea aquimaris]